MSKALSLDEFMNSSTSSGYSSFLQQPKKWPVLPDIKPAVKGVNVVLHRKDSIYMLWRHGMPRIHITEKEEKKVWGANHVCFEDESVLRNQHKRDDDGLRKVTPRTCPLCKMIEWFYQQITNGDLEWTDEIFRFEGDDPRENRVLHAGGICNMFGRRDLSDEEKSQMKKHGIYENDAWKENCWARANYMFLVVDYDDPNSGVQIAVQSSSLGDKVQTMIQDRRQSLGRDEGNPQINPFVMQWTYNEKKGLPFNEIYHARVMERLKVGPDILDLIDAPPPDVANIVKPFNSLEVRAALEDAALVKLPWEEWFGKGQVAAPQEKRSSEVQGKSLAEKRIAEKAQENRTPKSDPPPAADDEGEEFDCGSCDKGPVPANAKKCPFCGVKFEGEEEEEKEEEPAPPPRRKKGPAASAGASTTSTTKVAPKASGGPAKGKGAFPDDDNDVPF